MNLPGRMFMSTTTNVEEDLDAALDDILGGVFEEAESPKVAPKPAPAQLVEEVCNLSYVSYLVTGMNVLASALSKVKLRYSISVTFSPSVSRQSTHTLHSFCSHIMTGRPD
jgi:hypothetical protein